MRLIDCFSPLISVALHAQNSEMGAESVAEQLTTLVERCRVLCGDHGYSAHQREQALFAVAVWIDEQRLCDERLRGQWVHYSLQKALFNTTNGGDEFYNRFEQLDKADTELCEVYLYCLVMGFRGKMFDSEDVFEQFCQETFGCDSASIGGSLPEPLFPASYDCGDGGGKWKRRNRSFFLTLLFMVLSAGLLGGLYLLGERSLGMVYSSLKTAGL